MISQEARDLFAANVKAMTAGDAAHLASQVLPDDVSRLKDIAYVNDATPRICWTSTLPRMQRKARLCPSSWTSTAAACITATRRTTNAVTCCSPAKGSPW